MANKFDLIDWLIFCQ